MSTEEAVDRMSSVLRRKHLALATEQSYCGWLRRYCRFLHDVKPEGTTEQKMAAFLTQLAKQQVSASTQNQAFNAILFFYREVMEVEVGRVDSLRAKQPVHLRTAPTVAEVRALLDQVQDVAGYPTRLILRMIYGMGLRVSEPLNVRLKDLDLKQSRLILRGAKGGKDRALAIPCALSQELAGQVEFARAVHARDRAAGVPVPLPGLLGTKYPAWKLSPNWAWLFPAHGLCRAPRTGEVVRYRCLEVNVQRCCKAAAAKLHLEVTPHHLRHAYATHLLDRGVNMRALQLSMGHANVETTMGYCHADALAVPSPLEGGLA